MEVRDGPHLFGRADQTTGEGWLRIIEAVVYRVYQYSLVQLRRKDR